MLPIHRPREVCRCVLAFTAVKNKLLVTSHKVRSASGPGPLGIMLHRLAVWNEVSLTPVFLCEPENIHRRRAGCQADKKGPESYKTTSEAGGTQAVAQSPGN